MSFKMKVSSGSVERRANEVEIAWPSEEPRAICDVRWNVYPGLGSCIGKKVVQWWYSVIISKTAKLKQKHPRLSPSHLRFP